MAEKTITIPPVKLQRMAVSIVGITPLLTNRFSEASKTAIEEKQQHVAKMAKDTRYDGGSFARMLKRRVEAAGFDSALFSGHSCRRGFATSADDAGADLQSIAGQLRHAKLDTTRGYTEAGDLFRKNPGRGVV